MRGRSRRAVLGGGIVRQGLMLGTASCLAAVVPAVQVDAQLSDQARARRVRVMVTIPERHWENREMRRLPDPACETAVCRALIAAGYKVIDRARSAELRDSEQLDRAVKGGSNAAVEMQRIGRKYGADVLVTGEAFTQEVWRGQLPSGLGQITQVRCKARIELQAFRTHTGERIYVDSIQKAGPPDSTVELASKACLEEAAEEMCPGLLKGLDAIVDKEHYVELQVRGLGSATRARQLELAIAKLPGVLDVSPWYVEANTYSTEITLTDAGVRSVPALLESSKSMKQFGLRLFSKTADRIIMDRR